MHRFMRVCFAAFVAGLCFVSDCLAEETHVEVHVISKGAKFIGDSMGGTEITLEDANTGELLDRGKTSGTTGDTQLIMNEKLPHHAPVATDDAAGFRSTLDLDEPRRIRVVARGPLAQPQAAETVSATQWIVPGKHITSGDALTLEMPGLVVDILDPPAHLKLSPVDKPVKLLANVTMMCGCPLEPGGLWDANQFEVAAIVEKQGDRVAEIPLDFAGSTSQFAGSATLQEAGAYEITVYAYNSSDGNTGVDKTTIVLQESGAE